MERAVKSWTIFSHLLSVAKWDVSFTYHGQASVRYLSLWQLACRPDPSAAAAGHEAWAILVYLEVPRFNNGGGRARSPDRDRQNGAFFKFLFPIILKEVVLRIRPPSTRCTHLSAPSHAPRLLLWRQASTNKATVCMAGADKRRAAEAKATVNRDEPGPE
jgi:hypothetical protein